MKEGGMKEGDTMQTVSVRLLGPVEVVGPGGVRDLDGLRPTRILLALYAAEHHRLSLEELADRCFSDVDRPDDPNPALRTAVRRVRRALGDDAVRTISGGYEFVPSAVVLDIDRFEEHVAAGRASADPVAAATHFGHALELWRGEPFSGHEAEWLDLERHRLEESHLVALEGWHEAHLRNGAVTDILPSLEASAANHPLRERFWRQLMHALYLNDRQADALRAFQRHREALIEAGLEPSAETVKLEQQIATADPSLRAGDGGRPLRGYRITERLGEGAFSIVYRGSQPSVGRDVAIKQIRSELANRPEFIRRFETEAHLVARLEHPYIVPLYDYWREPGSAYLVMRYLRGGTLESRLLDGPLSVAGSRRLVGQIGAALRVAHRAGVVHRDVKPANILLDEEGNAYLTDFGIALEAAELLDPEASLSAGSPAYASPEQLRRQPVGPSADVHGLAIAVYEAMTGRLPFPDEPTQAALLQRQLHDPIPLVRSSRNDVPTSVDDVLQQATAKDAVDRYQSVEAFMMAFEAAFDGQFVQGSVVGNSMLAPGQATIVAAEERNPFKGLRAFTEADATDFAGRARMVDQLLDEVAAHRLVAVVGPSGSGKSSVVRAGLLPALRSGRLPGSDEWFVTTLMPGAHPHEELEAALVRVATEQQAGLLDLLRDGDRGFSRALRRVLPEEGELLLVIDQFEELFTLCDDAAERRQFLDALAAAVSEERSRLRVVLTLRADFFDRPLRYESIGRLVRDATVPVLPLAADELERAVVDPAQAVGCAFEPGLVSEIVADVADQPGALPMLQYALTELYERRVSGLLTRTAYHELGGVTGALAARAEELFNESSSADQGEIRRIFGRLVTLGEGAEDTRRRVVRSELGSASAVDSVIGAYGSARLLSFDRDLLSREPTVEVAHEALIREWPRLRGWLEDDRDGLRVLRHLTESAAAWESAGRESGELYRGGRLEAAESWAGGRRADLTESEVAFLDAGLEARAAEKAAEVERLEAERRSNRRLRRLLAGVAVALALALVAGVLAFQQRGVARESAADASAAQVEAEQNAASAEEARTAAEQQAFVAETGRLVASAEALIGTNPRAALLTAVAAYRREASPATLGALQRTLSTTGPLLQHVRWGEEYVDVDWVVGNRLLATRRDRLELIDLASAELLDQINVEPSVFHFNSGDPGAMVDVSDDGRRAVVATSTPSLVLYDVAEGAFDLLHEWPLEQAAIGVAIDPVGSAVASMDDRFVVTSYGADGELRFVTDVDDHTDPFDLHRDYFGPDTPLADYLSTRPIYGTLSMNQTEVFANVYFTTHRLDNQGQVIAPPTANGTASGDFGLLGSAVVRTKAHADTIDLIGVSSVAQVKLSELGPSIRSTNIDATTGGGTPFVIDGTFRDGLFRGVMTNGQVWTIDPATGNQLQVLDLGFGAGYNVAVLPNETMAVAHGLGLTVVALDGSTALASALPRQPIQTHLSTNRDGTSVLIALPGAPGPVDLWQIGGDGAWSRRESPVLDDLWFALLEYDTDVLATEDSDRLNGLYELDSLEEIAPKTGWLDGVSGGTSGDIELEPPLNVLGAAPPAVLIFDTLTGELRRELEVPNPAGVAVLTVARFDPDVRRLLVGDAEGHAQLWDVATWQAIDNPAIESSDIAVGEWSTDGRLVATASSDGQVTVRDGETFEPIRVMIGATGTSNTWGNGTLLFSPDNLTLLTNFDGPGRLWDVATGEQIGDSFPTITGSGASVSDRFHLVTSTENSVLVWNLDMDRWPDIACHVAGAEFTSDEWLQWGPRDQEPHSLCETAS